MRKLLTLSLLVALISVNVFGQNQPVKIGSFDRYHAAKAYNINSKIQARVDTTIFANFLPCDSFIFYYSFDAKKPIDSGRVEGNNFLLCTDNADYYAFGDAGLTGNILGVGFQWAQAKFKTVNDKITLSVLRNDGPGGAPGSVLASIAVKMSTLDTTAGAFNEVFFSSPVSIPGNCYMACTFPAYVNNAYATKPAMTLFQSGFGLFQGNDDACPHDSATGTGWIKQGGTWYNYHDFWGDVGTSHGYVSLSLYAITTLSTSCTLTITPTNPSICVKKSVSLTASGTGITSFKWAPSTGLNKTTGATVSAKPTVTTTYTCTGTTSDGGTCQSTVTVTVLNTPTVTVSVGSCQGAGKATLTATASSGGDPLKYQWKLGGTNISGATKSTFTTSANGSYTCQVTDKTTNCKTTSAAKSVNCRIAESSSAFEANAYPNPFTSSLTVNISSSSTDAATVELMDFSGRTLKVYNNVDAGSPFTINENLSAGVYFVRVTQGESSKMIKVVKN